MLKHERFHGSRTARHVAAGAPPAATIRRPVGAKNGTRGHNPPPRWGEERHPWPQSAAPLGLTTAVAKSARLCPLREIAGVAFVQFFTLHSALCTLDPCSPSQSLFFYILRLLAWKLCTTTYAHPSMSQTIKFESKSIKKATFSVKKRSKRRAFRHAHLNILPLYPLWR